MMMMNSTVHMDRRDHRLLLYLLFYYFFISLIASLSIAVMTTDINTNPNQ